MRVKLLVSSLSLFLCVSCTSVSSVAKDGDHSPALEHLYGISLENNAIAFKVKSNGCTTENDFVFKLNAVGEFSELSVIRTKEDRCRRMPKVIEVSKTMDYVGVGSDRPIKLLNPLLID